jgi:hypothetical protein
MATSMLDKVKATARAPEPRSKEQLEAEIYAMRSAQESMFGVENSSKQRLENAAFRLSQDLKFQDLGYKRLSLAPLSWTKGILAPVPVFALYDINDPVMVLSNEGGLEQPSLIYSTTLQSIYKSLARGLGNPSKSIVRIRSTFDGVIPMEVRPKIKEAIDLFELRSNGGQVCNRVSLMAEVEHWSVSRAEKPRLRQNWDPLVVGWDGLDLWLVTAFDVAKLESYVVKEFPAIEAPLYLALPEHK